MKRQYNRYVPEQKFSIADQYVKRQVALSTDIGLSRQTMCLELAMLAYHSDGKGFLVLYNGADSLDLTEAFFERYGNYEYLGTSFPMDSDALGVLETNLFEYFSECETSRDFGEHVGDLIRNCSFSGSVAKAFSRLYGMIGRFDVKYYERYFRLLKLMDELLNTEELANLAYDSGYVMTSGTKADSVDKSVSQPIDASALDESIVDLMSSNAGTSSSDLESRTRTSNYFDQFSKLWQSWKDVKAEMLEFFAPFMVQEGGW